MSGVFILLPPANAVVVVSASGRPPVAERLKFCKRSHVASKRHVRSVVFRCIIRYSVSKLADEGALDGIKPGFSIKMENPPENFETKRFYHTFRVKIR